MKKVIFFSLIIALIGALIMPAIATPAPAEAAGTTVQCTSESLNFVVYEGIDTYALGIIPLDNQKLTLNLLGNGISGWTVTDNAKWLDESLLFGVLSSISSKTRTTQVGVSVNSKGLTAGTYAATITFKITTSNTKTIPVQVTLVVRKPMVLGPLCIGLDKDLGKSIMNESVFAAVNEYSGITARLLVNASNVMDMQALQMNPLNGGNWNLVLQCTETNGKINVAGGTLTIEGATKNITGGGVSPLSVLLGAVSGKLSPELIAALSNTSTYVVMMVARYQVLDANGNPVYNPNGSPKYKSEIYAMIVLADLDKMLDIIPKLDGLLSGGSSDGSGTSLANLGATSISDEGIVLPLQPILSLLPQLMPVMINLLSNETVLALLKPLAGAIPPVVILMPMDTLNTLFSGL